MKERVRRECVKEKVRKKSVLEKACVYVCVQELHNNTYMYYTQRNILGLENGNVLKSQAGKCLGLVFLVF